MVRSLITLIVKPDNQGRIDMSEFADAMPAEVSAMLHFILIFFGNVERLTATV